MNCLICGKEISKRQSLSFVKDGVTGRACREHDEVIAYHKQLERKEADAKLAEKVKAEKAEEKRRLRFDPVFASAKVQADRAIIDGCCWKCGKPGYTFREYAGRVLIAIEKKELKGNTTVVKEMNLEGKVELAAFDFNPQDYLYNHDIFMIANFLGKLNLCPDCAKKTGRDFQKAWEPKFEMTMEKLNLGMALSAIMKPELQKIAKEEIALEQLKN